jgi:hypothetical protein
MLAAELFGGKRVGASGFDTVTEAWTIGRVAESFTHVSAPGRSPVGKNLHPGDA